MIKWHFLCPVFQASQKRRRNTALFYCLKAANRGLFGKVTLLQGDPGDGKSKLMLSLAALLSRGALLPFSDDEESYHNDYTYQGDKLVQVRHNTSDNAAEDVTYVFA